MQVVSHIAVSRGSGQLSIMHPTERTNLAQGRFWGGSGRRAEAHTRPALPKIPLALPEFPLLGAHQVLCNNPPCKGVKAWGTAPWGWRKFPVLRQHATEPRWPKHDRPKCASNNWRGGPNTGFWPVIYHALHRTNKFGTKPFLRWVRLQGRSPHASGTAKNTFGPVDIPFIRGTSGARK